MNTKQKVAIVFEVVLLAVMFILPPYAGIDRESDGRIHAFLGYYPVWDTPSSEDVFHALRQRFPSLEDLGASADDVNEARLSSFSPLFNKVRLIFNVTVSLVITGLLLILLRSKIPRLEPGDC